MTTKYTPGPWRLQQKGPGFYVTTDSGFNVAAMNASPADANMITAAPDLYDACCKLQEVAQHLINDCGDQTVIDWALEIHDAASDAIAKARGG